jgi:anaerobic magnesium-protoporphyrin IX monomethyl ester cyclase
MKILIGQSYFRTLDPKELERKMPYPPLGSLYAATILRDLNHQIIFFDSMMSRPDDFLNQIKNEKPDLILLYDDEFNYLTKMCLSNMRDAAVKFIKKARFLSIPTVVYSSDATDFPQSYLSAGCNAIIYGEGEGTLKEVVTSLNNNSFERDKLQINGLKFLHNGSIHVTPKRKLLEDLNSLPDPDYSFVNMNEYKKEWINNHGYFSTNISTTRGCPYRCNWCAKPIYGQTYDSFSSERVVNQIKDLKEKYSVDHFWITDDIFGLKPGWIKEFAAELKKHDIKIEYKCLTRPDLLLRGDTINDLKESGCKNIWIGAESGSQKILDAMDKGTTVKQIYQASKRVKEAGMDISFFIQFGYTGETREDINLTRKMIRDCLPSDIGVSVSYPLPGTLFYERVKNELRNKTNWKDSDDLDPMLIGVYERNFYKILHRFVHAEYRIFKMIRSKNWEKFPYFLYYLAKMIFLILKMHMFLFKPKRKSLGKEVKLDISNQTEKIAV